jgi:hypothetical protein
MKTRVLVLRWLALLSVVSVFSCAAPKAELTSVWKDQNYQGEYFKKVLVIGAARKETLRTFSEDEFVRQLKGGGTDAVASYSMIPFEKMMDRDVVAEKIKGSGIGGILVTRVLYTLTDAPPLRKQPNWNEFYSDSFVTYERTGTGPSGDQRLTGPKISPGKMIARIEMNLYETGSEKPVWSASSDLPLKEDPRDEIRAFVSLVLQELSRERLIR